MNFLVDTHCHLYKEYYDDIDKVLNDSNKLGVKYFITDGVDNQTNNEVINIVNKYHNVFGAIGIHPENVDDYNEEDISFIESNINNSKIIAIGEIGLDYHYGKDNREKQIELFEKQLRIAEKYNMPVVIHSRDASFDTINILKKYKLKGVIHCFSGSKEIASEYIKMGYYLGVTGVVTFNNAKIINVIKEIGLDYFILETDSPYLAPVPKRGEKNIPGNEVFVADFIARNLDVDKDYLAEITNKNITSIFDKILLK